jgi:hypothetical protein
MVLGCYLGITSTVMQLTLASQSLDIELIMSILAIAFLSDNRLGSPHVYLRMNPFLGSMFTFHVAYCNSICC